MKAKKRVFYRSVAKMLCAFMLIPHLLIAVGSTMAVAQVQGSDFIAVIDFANRSKFGDSSVSRLATDAVVVELTNSNKFSVATRQQIQNTMNDLDLVPPMTIADVLRMGERLAVNSVVVGEITEVRITDKPRQAQVDLTIRMLDASTGEPMNGAIVRGRSTPRETFTGDDDVLVTEAINNAAYIAVRRMVDYIIPEATVLNSVGDNAVLLNKGAQDGIRVGQQMIVSRQGEVIGKIRVSEVSNNDSQATVVSAVRGVKPEDKARAIFDMPETISGGFGEPVSRVSGGVLGGPTKKKGNNILPLLLGLGLLVALIGGHKSGGEAAGASYVEAGVPPSINVLGGTVGVRIKLDANRFGATGGVLQYKIWRDDMPFEPILVAPPGASQVIDFEALREIDYLELDPNTPNEAPDVKTAVNNPLPGISPGTTYSYRVSAVTRRIQSLQGGDDDGPTYIYEETQQQHLGTATPISKILRADMLTPVNNATDIDLTNVDFSWNSVLGADNYIIEASLSPSFNDVKYRSEVVLTSPSSDGELITLADQNLAAAFAGITSSQTVFWRIGYRNSGDTPGPIPDSLTGLRYIYSEIAQFRQGDAPPPPP